MTGFRATLSPSLAVRRAAEAMDWYQSALGAKEVLRLKDSEGIVVHGELSIGGQLVMLSEENPQFNASPETTGRTSVVLHLLVDDAQQLTDQALAAGATVVIPLADQFYGHKSGRIKDPFGHEWIIAEEIESVSPVEMQRRLDRMMEA